VLRSTWRKSEVSNPSPSCGPYRLAIGSGHPTGSPSLLIGTTGLARFARLAALRRAPEHLHVLTARSTGALKMHLSHPAVARVQALLFGAQCSM
jgi:hypothetical protein